MANIEEINRSMNKQKYCEDLKQDGNTLTHV